MAEAIKADYKPKSDTRERKFKSPILEFLSRTPVYAPVTMFLCTSAGMLYFAISRTNMSVGLVIGLFFAGWFTFTLLEYVMHRWLFHMHIGTEFRRKVQYGFHGIHHEYPKDKNTLAMPLPMSASLGVIFFFSFWLLLEVKTYGFIPGMYTGYAMYLLVHFVVHAYAPPKNYFRHLWISHAIHHYKDDTVVYGVSSQLWDHIFGTMPKKDKSAKQEEK